MLIMLVIMLIIIHIIMKVIMVILKKNILKLKKKKWKFILEKKEVNIILKIIKKFILENSLSDY